MTKREIISKLNEHESVIDVHTHVGIAPRFYYQFGYPYSLSFEDLVIRMQVLGVDRSVIFPFVDSAFYKKDTDAAEIKTTTTYCDFPYQIENSNLLNEVYEIFPQYCDKALPFLMFDPSRKTGQQAEHMAFLCEQYPVFGIKTASTYIQAFINDLDSVGQPILDLARDKDLPVLFHSSVHPADPWASVHDIVAFAERHPDIRICLAHSARFTQSVLEKAHLLQNCFVDFSAFIIHCQLAAQNSPHVASQDKRFAGDYDDPLSVMQNLISAYPDTMLWGSDTPAYYWIQKYFTDDGKLVEDSLKCDFQDEVQLLRKLPLDSRKTITYKNTLRFLFGGLS